MVALNAGASSPITRTREYAKNIINFLYQYTVHIIISCRDHLASCKMGDTAIKHKVMKKLQPVSGEEESYVLCYLFGCELVCCCYSKLIKC